MATKALLVRIEARRGRGEAVASLLRDALPIAQAEPRTTAWFALRLDLETFGIFDAFPDEAGRREHLEGEVAALLKARGEELFERLVIEQVDLLAAKLPVA